VYHSLIALGTEPKGGSRVYGHPAPVYRATSEVDGSVYILRRIEGESLSLSAAGKCAGRFRKLADIRVQTGQ
jgi:PAB-dependent poly(A)-specific ribonuclease subunit 3